LNALDQRLQIIAPAYSESAEAPRRRRCGRLSARGLRHRPLSPQLGFGLNITDDQRTCAHTALPGLGVASLQRELAAPLARLHHQRGGLILRCSQFFSQVLLSGTWSSNRKPPVPKAYWQQFRARGYLMNCSEAKYNAERPNSRCFPS
jgi:hypothetical protein